MGHTSWTEHSLRTGWKELCDTNTVNIYTEAEKPVGKGSRTDEMRDQRVGGGIYS
jgi:hypothetical protein